jgi:hypothetical protein
VPSRLAPFRAWLGHRQLPLYAALVAVVLTLPSLGVGLQLDDYPQRLVMLRATQVDIPPLSVFASLPGDAASNLRFMDRGILPWWAVPDTKLAFCRVLSAASLWLDYQLFPDSPALMHAESLLWFALTVAAVALLYRRLLAPSHPAWVVGLAALLYAVDPGHGVPVAWIANRNAVLASLFGALALLAHDRWRRDGWRPGALGSALCLALALLSGETALGAAAYLAAYAGTIESGGPGRRLGSLLPAGVTLGAWAIYYRLAGFGTRGSGMYLDPLGSPAAFAAAFFRRVSLLLLGQWTPIPAEMAALVPARQGAFVLAGWGVTALLAVAFLPLLQRDRTARFFALGMGLALVPSAAALPSNRLLFWVSFGALGLLAQFLGGVYEQADWRPLRAGWRIVAATVAGAMLLFHLILAPFLLVLMTLSVRALGEPVAKAAATMPGDLGGRNVVAVNAPEYLLFVSFVPSLLPVTGKPLPRSMRGLVAGPFPVTVTRLDERTLALHLEGGLFDGLLGRLFRGADRPLAVGQEIALPGMSARVASLTPDGQPRDVVFRFAVPLEDPSLFWLRWSGEGFVPFTPPAIGRTVLLPAPRSAFALPGTKAAPEAGIIAR